MSEPTILDDLKSDHEEIRLLAERLQETPDPEKRRVLFSDFKSLLLAHSHAEDEVLYKPLKRTAAGRLKALEGEEEHEVAEFLAARLKDDDDKGGDAWTARSQVIKEMLDHHIDEEEDEVFQAARDIFGEDRLVAMGAQFRELKEDHLRRHV